MVSSGSCYVYRTICMIWQKFPGFGSVLSISHNGRYGICFITADMGSVVDDLDDLDHDLSEVKIFFLPAFGSVLSIYIIMHSRHLITAGSGSAVDDIDGLYFEA